MRFNFCICSIRRFPRFPVGIVSSVVGLKTCAVTAGIKKYRSIIKQKRKKHDNIVLLAKTKLNNTEVLISKVLID